MLGDIVDQGCPKRPLEKVHGVVRVQPHLPADRRDREPIGVMLADTKLGGVETHADARKCAELVRATPRRIDGVLVVLPNFGDEKGVADTLKLAGLNVPVLVQAIRTIWSNSARPGGATRFCGKISVCNNLAQAGIRFSLTRKHVVRPDDASFHRGSCSVSSVCAAW
jgi:L-fucose isomerase-like protein